MVPRFKFLTKLSEARAINDTDRPYVLALERSKFLRARLLLCYMLCYAYILNSSRSLHLNKNFPHIFERIFEFQIKSDSPTQKAAAVFFHRRISIFTIESPFFFFKYSNIYLNLEYSLTAQ